MFKINRTHGIVPKKATWQSAVSRTQNGAGLFWLFRSSELKGLVSLTLCSVQTKERGQLCPKGTQTRYIFTNRCRTQFISHVTLFLYFNFFHNCLFFTLTQNQISICIQYVAILDPNVLGKYNISNVSKQALS